MTILIIDYGMGNIASARRSLEDCGATVAVSNDPRALDDADRAFIPGVGSFAEAMARLSARGWVEALRAAALVRQMPVLGVCLGMQLLADEGEEGGRVAGLGLISGRVVRLIPTDDRERVPHVGWNDVHAKSSVALFRDIPTGSDFYFVHSFHFEVLNEVDATAVTDYCGGIVAAVSHANVHGVQFHPEKSSNAGRLLLRNFLALPC